uniref:Uncharacterized protein n=1 Tax=Microplitis mediator bracovirus TaxID=1836595 RepID=A0A1D5APG9_9VIRU|nr:hypothetical protein A6F54_38 [Microplitis mediator bracovirus]
MWIFQLRFDILLLTKSYSLKDARISCHGTDTTVAKIPNMNCLNLIRKETDDKTNLLKNLAAFKIDVNNNNTKDTKKTLVEKPNKSVWKKMFQRESTKYSFSQPNDGRRGSSSKVKEVDLYDVACSWGLGDNL